MNYSVLQCILKKLYIKKKKTAVAVPKTEIIDLSQSLRKWYKHTTVFRETINNEDIHNSEMEEPLTQEQ